MVRTEAIVDHLDANRVKTEDWVEAAEANPSDQDMPKVSVIVVSYNTRDLTLRALETLFATTVRTKIQVIVLDNDSKDGSAEAIKQSFPEVELICSSENLGFARGNNVASSRANAEWILLLNPDTECHEGAIDNLLAFAELHPEASIFGGRTVYPDGSLNIASCWRKSSLWSLFCSAFGLTLMFPNSSLFNVEAMGAWRRDDVREVDIVSGCFFLTRRELWEELGGFDLTFFMYGEEVDFCLRARKKGCRLMITPDAEIMHLVGAATGGERNARKTNLVYTSKVSIMRKHWSKFPQKIGLFLLKLSVLNRVIAYKGASLFFKKYQLQANHWSVVWSERREWGAGFV